MNKKKLLFILPTLNIGGAEKVTVNILNSLDSKVFDINLIVIDSRYKNLESSINKDVNIKYLNITKTRNAFFRLLKEIVSLKPDVVFSSLNRTNILILFIKFLYPFFKVVIREPSMPSVRVKNGYTSKNIHYLIKWLYPLSNKIIAQTKYMKKEIEEVYKIDEKKIVIISNPLDERNIIKGVSDNLNPFYTIDKHNFVYVGSLRDVKNPFFLLNVFSGIRDRNS